LQFTKTEMEDIGINLSGKDVNSNCLGHLGGNECRCIIFPTE